MASRNGVAGGARAGLAKLPQRMTEDEGWVQTIWLTLVCRSATSRAITGPPRDVTRGASSATGLA